MFLGAGIDNGAWLATNASLRHSLSALVVLEDPPIEPTAFWPTRMISARQLFLEKALFVLFLLVIPRDGDRCTRGRRHPACDRHFVVLAVPESLLDWTVLGRGRDDAGGARHVARGRGRRIVRLAVVPIALPFALGAFAFLTKQSWLMPFGVFMFSNGQDRPEVTAAAGVSRALAARVGVLLVALGITAWTYARRHRRGTWAVVYGGMVALVLLWTGVAMDVRADPRFRRSPPFLPG